MVPSAWRPCSYLLCCLIVAITMKVQWWVNDISGDEGDVTPPFEGGAVAATFGYSLVGFTEWITSFLNPVVSED